MKPVRKVVFPVNGLGTRFLPATKAMPKEMLPIVDKPLIQYAVEEAARGADLLCMDATYPDDADLDKAKLYGHATCRETGALAARAGVRRLWLTHYSAAVTDLEPGLVAARRAYPDAVAGTDGLRLELDFDKEE